MSSTGLLVVSNIKHFGKSLRAIEKYVNSLYVHLNVPTKPEQPAPTWSRLVSQLYADSTAHIGNKLDIRILLSPLKQTNKHLTLKPVDMIFSDGSSQLELCKKLRCELNIPAETICLDNDDGAINYLDEYKETNEQSLKTYDDAVIGGTFDRIHVGHKIFLTQTVLRARNRLIVGVTTSALTKSKILPELILPSEERIRQVRDFLVEIDNTLHYDIVPIDDPFGPTRYDPKLDLIVVSAETLRGGHKVNELRASNNLSILDIFAVDLIESNVQDGIHEAKVSSSNRRIDMLGTRLKKVIPRPNLPPKPYIIGLTGGIASGKSKMAERLGSFGGYVIDCDKVAHQIYEPGQVCYNKIVTTFGQNILAADGRIDRSKLGSIVFGNAQQLEILNGIVWPELLLEVKRRLANLRNANDSKTIPQVVVLEAAVLLRAGWETECHEVWSMIVPPEEAIRRVVKRNGLTEEEARKRLNSQPTNDEIVAKSNVIFSSQWDYDFTQKQAESAWQMLTTELEREQSNL